MVYDALDEALAIDQLELARAGACMDLNWSRVSMLQGKGYEIFGRGCTK